MLAPGWTKYDKTCLYDTRDITAQLRTGPNAIGLLLGGGMYRVPGGRYAKFTASMGPLTAIAHLRLEYADGRTEIVGTDDRWRTSPGPITFSCMFGGEDFDAGAEPPGWSEPGFDERDVASGRRDRRAGWAVEGRDECRAADWRPSRCWPRCRSGS